MVPIWAHEQQEAKTPLPSPGVLFGGGIKGVWFDPSDLSTVWQDNARTIAGAVDAVVGCIDDKSGNGKNATQATASKKPILRQAGNLYYLEFDGVDDFLQTAAIDFTGTNASAMFVGLRKSSDAATALVAELSITSTTTAGTFGLFAPGTAGAFYRYRHAGTVFSLAEPGSFAAPLNSIISAQGKISTDNLSMRVNGVVAGTSVTDQGAGNLSNNILYIGMRAGTTLPLNGRLYGLIVLGRTPTAQEITDTEAFLATKTAQEIAIVGASIAAGQVATSYALSFGGLIRAALPLRIISDFGVPGRSSTTMLANFPAILTHKPATAVIATTLLNDAFYAAATPAAKLAIVNTWKSNIAACITLAVAANCRIVMCSPPPCDLNTADDVLTMNEIRDWISGLGVAWADFFMAGNNGSGHWLDGISADGVHPNDLGHRLLFGKIPLAVL